MYYSTAAANASQTTPRKSASGMLPSATTGGGYRLTASSAAVSSSGDRHRYAAAAASSGTNAAPHYHDYAAASAKAQHRHQVRAATPTGSPHHRSSVTHHQQAASPHAPSSSSPQHQYARPQPQYTAADRYPPSSQSHSHSHSHSSSHHATGDVYRAPPTQVARDFDPNAYHHQQSLSQHQQHSASSQRRVASVGPSSSAARHSASSTASASANVSGSSVYRGLQGSTSSTAHGTSPPKSISSSSSAQQPSLAGFCTQVAATLPPSIGTPTKGQKSSPPRHHRASATSSSSSSSLTTSTKPSTSSSSSSSMVKAPKYSEYNNITHPPHYFKDAPLLPVLYSAHRHRHLLCLDLDETLVHASATQPSSYDQAFNVDMDTQTIRIFVKHRPHMMEFLRNMARMYEVCVFTASLSKYANQVLDHIDPHKELITHRLYREHCTQVDGSYTKDMACLGRPCENVIILDNSPIAYMFFPNNAISCTSWFEDESDTELRTLIPRFEAIARAPTAMQGLHHRSISGTQRRDLL